jgi:hypothetical protein
MAREFRSGAADGAQADDAHRQIRHLSAFVQGFLGPASRDDIGGRRKDAAHQDQRGRDHIFGHAPRVRANGRNDTDIARPTGLDVDIVQSHAKAADHLATHHGVQQFAPDLREAPDDDRVGITRRHDQRLIVPDQSRIVMDLVRSAQPHQGFRQDALGDDDLHDRRVPGAAGGAARSIGRSM